MREEEKLAHDVYVALRGQARVFDNIIESEERHMAAVQTLLERYSLPDPTLGRAAGEFLNADLAQLYGELVMAGSASPSAALQVGVQIEELDLSDLQAALAQPLHLDIRTVYENLALASANHLTAFYSALLAGGGSYEPQYLTPSEFEACSAAMGSRTEGGAPPRRLNRTAADAARAGGLSCVQRGDGS
jgi:hypothetical protein